MRAKHDLSEHEFYRYLQLRDYYRKEVEMDPSMEVNGVITPKVKIKYLSVNLSCWRECGALSSDHAHVFWKCDEVQLFWKTVHKTCKRC